LSQRWTLIEGVKRTMAWYRSYSGDVDARELCLHDFESFAREAEFIAYSGAMTG
jgi:hypothetical protein